MLTDQNISFRPESHVTDRIVFCLKNLIKRLIARKPLSQVQSEIETQNELRRALNWWQLTAIGLGAIIGKRS